mgnify:CR=1 FL=1
MTHTVEVFFDGDCPLCKRELDFLRRRDRDGRILATDIAASDFSAARYGRRQEDFMASIQGRLPSGEWITGVEVFRQLYAAVGFRRLVWLSRQPGISWILDRSYALFAKNRLRLTGRCDDGACQLPRESA